MRVMRLCLFIWLGALPAAWAQPCIGVVPGGGSAAFWNLVRDGALQAGAELDVPVYYRGPRRESEEHSQLQVIELMVERGCRALVVAPAGPSIAPRVAELRARGIPTLYIDRDMGGEAVLAVVGTDNFAAGQAAGRHMAELLGGRGQVLLLRLSEKVVSTRAREDGFLQAAREAGLVVVDGGDVGDDNLRIQQLLEGGRAGYAGLFSPNALTTTAAHVALRRLGMLDRVRHVGFDSSQMLVKALAAGEIDALVLQQARRMGYEGVRLANEALAGHPPANPPRLHGLPVTLGTPANLRQPDVAELLGYQPD